MLRKIRIVAAIIFLLCITAMFIDWTGTLRHWFGWMAKIQFLPALLALNVVVVAALVVLTLLCGRIYCSVICPMGVFQDVVNHLSAKRKGKKKRFKYLPANNWLRYGVFALFVIAILAGFTAIASFIAPYSAYGRMVQNLFAPIAIWINNLFADVAESNDSYAFIAKPLWIRSWAVFIVAALTFIIITALVWWKGRIYCNTICPVGTLLGFLSRFSWLRPVINTDKCANCGSCGRRCKASCINTKEHTIDLSRCVACMDCIDECSFGAISFTTRRPKLIKSSSKTKEATPAKEANSAKEATPAKESTPAKEAKAADSGRRSFIIAGATVAGSAIIAKAQKTTDGGLAVIEDKQPSHRKTKLVPPGAQSLKNFTEHCTACQLCVSQCPNGVLRPSTDLDGFMQPEMSYERGFCRPECTACSSVCPAGAIIPIAKEDKSAIQIGRAVWNPKNCVVLTDDVECGNCARHCPTGAITMVPSDPNNPDSRKIPTVDENRCIGCGACENLCPARPFSAIYVEGNERHRNV